MKRLLWPVSDALITITSSKLIFDLKIHGRSGFVLKIIGLSNMQRQDVNRFFHID